MRKIILIIMSLSITSLLHSYDFEFEVLSNEGDIRVIELPDLLTYRQFYVKSNYLKLGIEQKILTPKEITLFPVG